MFAKNKAQPLLENDISKQPAYIRYVIAKLPKFFEISLHTSLDFFLQRITWKLKSVWN